MSNKISGIWDDLEKILSYTVIINVYSWPDLFLETGMLFLMGLLYIALVLEISKEIKQIKKPPIKIKKHKKPIKSIDSSRSINRTVIRTHPELGVDVVFKRSNIVKNDWNTSSKIGNVLSSSLSGFIQRDLKKIKSKFMKMEGDDDDRVMHTRRNQSYTDRAYELVVEKPGIQKRLASQMEVIEEQSDCGMEVQRLS